MKKLLVMTAVACMVAGAASGAEVSATLDVASAYVFRGATFNDGVVVQPGMEVCGFPVVEGLAVGVWGNLDIDDYDGAVADGQFSEIDLYASYDIPLPTEVLGLSVGYCEYTYPSGGGDADREVSIGLGLGIPLSPSVSINYGVDGGIEETLYVKLGIEHEQEVTEDLGLSASAAVGYVVPETGDSGFSHYVVTVGAGYSVVSASISYIGQIDDDVLPDVEDGGAYDADVVGMIGVGLDF